MPFTLTLKSAVLPTHFWEVQKTEISRYSAFHSALYTETSWVVTHDNALPSPSVVPVQSYLDQIQDMVANTYTATTHNEPLGSGGEVDIAFPAYQAKWGGIFSVRASLLGDFTTQHIIGAENYAHPLMTIIPLGSGGSGPTSAALVRPKSPAAGEEWSSGAGWRPYACGDVTLVDGREPQVARQRYLVCDAGYRDFITSVPAPGWNGTYGFTGATERFVYNRADDFSLRHATDGASSKLVAWVNGAWGLTKQAQLYSWPSFYGALMSRSFDTPPSGAYETRIVSRVRFTMSNFQLVLDINFGGDNAPNDSASQVGLDCFDDIVACCWQGKPSGGKKQILVGIQRSLEKNIGSGSGSTGAWDVYNYGDVDERSPMGFLFLPNGWLFLSFYRYDGSGNPTAYYTVNKQHGERPASNWSTPAALTPNVAQALGIGRNMGQAFRTRIG